MDKIVVAVVILNNQALMVRRRQKEGALYWQFPSGGINSKESELSAAKREVFEETGVSCRGVRELGQRTHPDTGRDIVYILCDYVGGVPIVKDTEELDQVSWMNSDKVLQVVTSDLFLPVKNLLERLKK
ncbi:MAG: NUDIX hydrolase [Candidatus Harrisonbacteria bacterium]|nr:NUDIX hydrolase [Candidatus Harrisonbacteria bacterium]